MLYDWQRFLFCLASQRLPVQAHFVVLQFKWEEAKLLQLERDALIKELESSLSPEIVDQVSGACEGRCRCTLLV